MTALNDVGTIAQDVVNHIKAGHGLDNAKLVTDLETLRTDLDRVLDSIQVAATTDERVAATYREVARQGRNQETLMADLTALQAAIEGLDADEQAEAAAVLAKLQALGDAAAALQATIDGLTAGEVSQADIDALTAHAATIDAGINATAAAVAPVVATA